MSVSTATFQTPSLLQAIFPNRVPYQHILFLHQLFMFLSVALSRVVPQFVFIFGDGTADARKLDALERDIWERIYGTIAIADREGKFYLCSATLVTDHQKKSASIILHTILHSITPAPKSPEHPYHNPTLARMQPLSPTKTKEAFEQLTPEMRNLIIEANIKNQSAGPIANAWDAALRKADKAAALVSRKAAATAKAEGTRTPATPRTKNFWEKAAGAQEDPESSMVFVDTLDASAIVGDANGDGGLRRVPSTPRLGRRDLSSSPTKPRSPVRRGSFAGEI
jgi:hypothetical protein